MIKLVTLCLMATLVFFIITLIEQNRDDDPPAGAGNINQDPLTMLQF